MDFISELPKGFPTHTKDINGKIIRNGDICGYDFDDSTSQFEVVFEKNAFRKKYKRWDKSLTKPMLEFDGEAKAIHLKIIKPFSALTELQMLTSYIENRKKIDPNFADTINKIEEALKLE